jgi:hypothetical protein
VDVDLLQSVIWECPYFASMHYSWIWDQRSIINSRVWASRFFFYLVTQSSEVSYFQSVGSVCMWPLVFDDRDSLWEFEFQAFSMHSSYNPPECRIFEVRDLPPRVLLFWMTEIYFGSLGFGIFFCMLAESSKVSYFQSFRSIDACPQPSMAHIYFGTSRCLDGNLLK